MQINTTKSAALIDTNKDGQLREINSPALKEALATNKDSGWNFASDSISGNAFNSLMVKAAKAADTSPTVKKAADKVVEAQKELDKAIDAQKEEGNSLVSKLGNASALALIGGFFMAIFGLPAAGLAVVTAGAVGGAAFMAVQLFKMIKGIATGGANEDPAANVGKAKAKHESALADMFKAYNEVQANKAVARATDPSAALEA